MPAYPIWIVTLRLIFWYNKALAEEAIMPIYEYRCRHCHCHFEKLQKINDKKLDKCPECGGSLVRLVSSPAIQFRGSGWYITDYTHKNSSGGGNGNQAHKEATKTEKPADSGQASDDKK
jgi:putative FmdB family regulatory protein